MVANRAPGDGHHETAIMLDSRSSSGRETEPQLDWASDTRKNQRRNRRQLTWSCFLTLCCLSTLALAGLFFFRLSREQAQLPRPEHHEINTGASIISSIAAPSQTQSHEDENKPETALVSSDQLDLKTGFIISEKPTIRDYVFNITRELAAPDGFQKSMILVNGQSPGPLIEANTGDVIRVIVNNKMPEASTTIHWHGIDQRNTVWMDGVHGVTQCGIPPGESFTYEFNVTDQRGTFWYHSHSSVQYTDGLYGPIIIHSPDENISLIDDDKIVMVGDLFHEQAEQLSSEYLGESPSWNPGRPGMEPPPDNIIMNGQHVFNCSILQNTGSSSRHSMSTDCTGGSLYATRIKTGHQVRFRLISHSTSTPLYFTIDNHTLMIIEIDGVEIEPIPTTRVFLNPGQRYSVLVTANQTVGNYMMRTAAATGCFHLAHAHDGTPGLASIQYEATGILSYDDTEISAKLIGSSWELGDMSNPAFGSEPWQRACRDLPFDIPRPMEKKKAYDVGERNHHYFSFHQEMVEGVYRTYVNKTIFAPLQDDATIWKVLQPGMESKDIHAKGMGWDFGPNQQVLVSQDADKAAQIVINSETMMIHPWHLHGMFLNQPPFLIRSWWY
ncbi:multicopper oxidase-domain-containing protein [Ilyonectria robusta]|uniref:multicopper oxidase-domain-containing protein n=1 Tax=Ilyonectria robusta TaxID=1079257 RepID=UPI001E8EE3DD|nr:multicopper oxidase-domain-containing protein [Ilyonectria robusta]KAH8686455.1 multicopper oxidase-domain-containing protein [Ilyonectria robusta]